MEKNIQERMLDGGKFLSRVVSSNALSANISSNLNINEYRLLYWIMGQVDAHNDDRLLPIEADYKTLRKIFGYVSGDSGSMLSYVESLIKEVRTKTFHFIEETKEGSTRITSYPWFSYCITESNSKTVIFMLNDFLRQHLVQLQRNFNVQYVGVVSGFKHIYSVRLYSILCAYAYRGEVSFDIDQLRLRLGCLSPDQGIDRYSEFWKLRQRVLDPAVKEINEKSDLEIECEPIRSKTDGRRVTEIRFTICHKKSYVIPSPDFVKTESVIEERDVPGGIVRKVVLSSASSHSEAKD